MTQDIFEPIVSGNLDAVRAMLDADPGLVHARRTGGERDGETTLGAASVAGNLEIVKLLVARGAQVYARGLHGYPAVMDAHWEKRPAIVEYFLREIPDKAGGTNRLGVDINLAARAGWTDIVRTHLERDPLSVHARGVIRETPLHWAAHNGATEIVQLLLDAGADIEADEVGCYGGKPLHWASEHAPNIVGMLLAHGAQVDSRNVWPGEFLQMTPLIMCATQKNDDAACAEHLLVAGADIAARDATNRTALDYAAEHGHARVEAVLRSHGAA